MPHHPTLKEVFDKDSYPAEEWAEFTVKGIGWDVWYSAVESDILNHEPGYGFSCSALSSEYRSFSFAKVFLNFYFTSKENLSELKGDPRPLGSFSFYDDNAAIVNINITEEMYKDIISLVRSGIGELTVRIAIPKWDDSECKGLPLIGYQIMFKSQENKIKEESTESIVLDNLHQELRGISHDLNTLYPKSTFSWGWLAGGIVLGFVLAKLL